MKPPLLLLLHTPTESCGLKRKPSAPDDDRPAKHNSASVWLEMVLNGSQSEAAQFWLREVGASEGRCTLLFKPLLDGVSLAQADVLSFVRTPIAMAKLMQWHYESGWNAAIEYHELMLWSAVCDCWLAGYHGPGPLLLMAQYCSVALLLMSADDIVAKRLAAGLEAVQAWYPNGNCPHRAAGAELLVHIQWHSFTQGRMDLAKLPQVQNKRVKDSVKLLEACVAKDSRLQLQLLSVLSCPLTLHWYVMGELKARQLTLNKLRARALKAELKIAALHPLETFVQMLQTGIFCKLASKECDQLFRSLFPVGTASQVMKRCYPENKEQQDLLRQRVQSEGKAGLTQYQLLKIKGQEVAAHGLHRSATG
eukprot:gene13880-13999_t